MPAKKRTIPPGNRATSKKLRNEPAEKGTPSGTKTSSKTSFSLSPRAIKETLLFFGKPVNIDRNGFVEKEEERLAIWGTTCKIMVPQLKDLESLNKEWRFTIGLLKAGRHSVVPATSLISLDICANNATLESFIETLFKQGETLVLSRVPLMRGLIDVIIEEYQNVPTNDIRMRPLVYVCDEIPVRYPAMRHDSIESLWRSFDEYHVCETCTTRRKCDVFGSPWLLSCGECSQSTFLARYTCEEFGQRYAVRYHVRRPDLDDRWLTVELQFGWTTVGPFNTHRFDDLKVPKLEVTSTVWDTDRGASVARLKCVAVYLDGNAGCKRRPTKKRRSLIHDTFIRMDAFLFLPRRWLDTCQLTCSAWRNQIEEKSDELAIRDIYILSFHVVQSSLRLILPALIPGSVCETRVAELRACNRNSGKLSAKNEAFNAEQIKRHLQNSYVQYLAHSSNESNDIERLRDVTGIRIGHVLLRHPANVQILDFCGQLNVRTATFCLESGWALELLSRDGFFARANEVLEEYFITTNLRHASLHGDMHRMLDAMYHMVKCRRVSIWVGSEYSTVNAADSVNLDQIIEHLLASGKPSGFVRQLELVAPKRSPLERPRACHAPPHFVVDRLSDAEHLPGKRYEVYEFPCKKTSDVLTVNIWTSTDGQHIYRLQCGPFNA